jgi:hypothetical protein
MIFFSDSFSSELLNRYDEVWNLVPLDEPTIQQLHPISQTMLRFFDKIRQNVGKKLYLFTDLASLEITPDDALKLFLLVQLKQGHSSILWETNGGDPYLVYN